MRVLIKILLVVLVGVGLLIVSARYRPVETSGIIWPLVERLAIDEFVGISTNGGIQAGLFSVVPTGRSTEPVKEAAENLLAILSPEQREDAQFAVEDDEWRRWANIHISSRQGVSFAEMTDAQEEAVWALLAAGMSRKGVTLARDITRLEEHLAELMDDYDQYGEHRYWITIMGQPSLTEPWGWQFEGHHLIVNFFVLGDQVVMTPTFMGSEPVRAESGKYKGTEVLQAEQALGLALIRGLSESQLAEAVLSAEKPGNNNYGELFSDNAVVPLEGLALADLAGERRRLAEQLIRVYVDNIRPEHAEVRMAEVVEHWDATFFAWIGATDDVSAFYYRIQSPVILIEFDHQKPVALEGPDRPSRTHIHTVVRTPNGNDYGKDLLRQHLAAHPH
jgi:hypothetical protein